MARAKKDCEHPSTTLTKDWQWVKCADPRCGQILKYNPALEPPMGYCSTLDRKPA